MNRSRRQIAIRRRGMTVFEVAVSAVVLGAALTTAAQLVQWCDRSHQVALKKRCALEAATTVLDRISARDWTSITPESVKNIALPPEVRAFLVDPQLNVTVTNEADQPRGKKIAVEISWAERMGVSSQKVRLVTWVFQPGDAK